MIHDDSWWFMMIHDDSWWFMMIHDDSWWFMMIHDEPWWWHHGWNGEAMHDHSCSLGITRDHSGSCVTTRVPSWSLVILHDSSWMHDCHYFCPKGTFIEQISGKQSQRLSRYVGRQGIHGDSRWSTMIHHDSSCPIVSTCCLGSHDESSWIIMNHHEPSWITMNDISKQLPLPLQMPAILLCTHPTKCSLPIYLLYCFSCQYGPGFIFWNSHTCKHLIYLCNTSQVILWGNSHPNRWCCSPWWGSARSFGAYRPCWTSQYSIGCRA